MSSPGISAFTHVFHALCTATYDSAASTASCTGELWMTLDIEAGALRRLLEMIDQPGEQTAPVGRPERRFDVVFRVRHHAEHVALVVEHAGDGVGGAVHIPSRIERPIGRGIAQQHPALALDSRDGRFIGDIIALAMGDRYADHLSG